MSASDSVSPNLYADVLAANHAAKRSASRSSFLRSVALAEAVADTLIIAGGFALASIAGTHLFGQPASPLRPIASSAVGFTLLLVFLLHRDGTHDRSSGLLRIRETERTLRHTWQAMFLFAVMAPLLGIHLSLAAMLLSAGIVPAMLIGKGQIVFSILRRYVPADRAVIYGAGDSARAILSTLRNSPRTGLLPVAVIDDQARQTNDAIPGMDYRRSDPVPVLAGPVTPALLESAKCKVVVIAGSDLCRDRIERAMRAARDAGLATALVYAAPADQHCIHLDGLVMHTADGDASLIGPMAKRALDLLGSALLLIGLVPVLLFLAALIRLDSPGSALFTQERVGRHGRLFRMYKFRSMHTSSPRYAPSPVSSDDPRITRIGRLLRRMSLDELPQLINVLLGEMSLVGPRPEMPFIVDQYGPAERQRLRVLPGITGLWQLSADRVLPIHTNLEYDLYYIRNRTFLMDVAILIHTLIFAPRRGV